VLLTYPDVDTIELNRRVDNARIKHEQAENHLSLGVLGAGNYAQAMFLPTIEKVGGVQKSGIASASGLSARHASEKYGFRYASSSAHEVISDPEINLIAVLTRHNQHASQVLEGLRLGKHVFCEKPLALNELDLAEILSLLNQPESPLLMVGFNRRFSQYIQQMKKFLQGASEPLAAHYRVNAGYLPPTHWTQDTQVGGGRIIGEGCHFVDTLTYLVGSLPQTVTVQALPDQNRYHQDNVVMTVSFADGSLGTIHYLANGDKSLPKERLEVFCGSRVAIMDDFRSLDLIKNGRRKTISNPLAQDKGHRAAWEAFVNTVKAGGPAPISYEEIAAVHRTVFAAARALTSGDFFLQRIG